MSNTRLFWLHTLSPTHVGIGRGLGYIDLPIDREGVTNWPIIRGSALKGVWSDHFARKIVPRIEKGKDRRKLDTPESKRLKAAFGVAGENNDSNSGALIPTDARIVCLPVRSFRGTFAWVTSPLCLQMLARTLTLAGSNSIPAIPKITDADKAHHINDTALLENNHIYLEDLDLRAEKCSVANLWAIYLGMRIFDKDANWREQFIKRFVVLSDTVFDFLCQTGTEVHTRVRIQEDTKTVVEGALWTEESVPAETILMGVLQCDRIFGHHGEEITPSGLLDQFAKDELVLQMGGKATVGRGQVRCIFTDANGGTS